ncbi:hypothetical protein JXA32_17900 [Candidatus Sumerlaeota bacterium]|nr:hypothetical protein [Candidatus Sumerlaeota bacterium]
MYVSEKVKEDLRPYAGQTVLIDVKQVYQPFNPGRGRIDEFQYLGPAPKNDDGRIPDGIELVSSADLDGDGTIVAIIDIKNTGDNSVELFIYDLAFTLLTNRSEKGLQPADGLSFALMAQQNFESRWQGKFVSCAWSIGKENALPHSFFVKPGETRCIRIHFELPPGEYDFFCGYGERHVQERLSSNLTAFDIGEDGKGEIVAVENRDSSGRVETE